MTDIAEERLIGEINSIVEFTCEGDCEPCRYYNGEPIKEGGNFCTDTNKSIQILALVKAELQAILDKNSVDDDRLPVGARLEGLLRDIREMLK